MPGVIDITGMWCNQQRSRLHDRVASTVYVPSVEGFTCTVCILIVLCGPPAITWPYTQWRKHFARCLTILISYAHVLFHAMSWSWASNMQHHELWPRSIILPVSIRCLKDHFVGSLTNLLELRTRRWRKPILCAGVDSHAWGSFGSKRIEKGTSPINQLSHQCPWSSLCRLCPTCNCKFLQVGRANSKLIIDTGCKEPC